jgi:hypothetical protein
MSSVLAALWPAGDNVGNPSLHQPRRAQPNISLAWIASHMQIKRDAKRKHHLEALRRAGLD